MSNSKWSNPTWLECIEKELRSRKLPQQEVARLVAELADHLCDLAGSQGEFSPQPTAGTHLAPLPTIFKDEPMSTEANAIECLGNPAEIADTAVREFRRRKNLFSRSRLAAFVTFVLLPLPLLAFAWLASMTAISASLECVYAALEWSGQIPRAPDDLLETWFDNATQFEVIAVHLFLIAVLTVPAVGVAALYGRLARRTTSRWLWGLTACTLVGLGFGAAQYDLKISDQPGKSQLLFMVGIGRQPLRQCCYSVLPMCIGVLVLRRSGRNAEPGLA
jgi:hypothetical protein